MKMQENNYTHDLIENAVNNYQDQLSSFYDEEYNRLETVEQRIDFSLVIQDIAEFLASPPSQNIFFSNSIPVFKAKFIVSNQGNYKAYKKTWNATNSLAMDLNKELVKRKNSNAEADAAFLSENPNGNYKIPTDALAMIGNKFSIRRILPTDDLHFIGTKNLFNSSIKMFNPNASIMESNISVGERLIEMAMVEKIQNYKPYLKVIDNANNNVSPIDRAIFECLAENLLIPEPFQPFPTTQSISMSPNKKNDERIITCFPDIQSDETDRYKLFTGGNGREMHQDVEIDHKANIINYKNVKEGINTEKEEEDYKGLLHEFNLIHLPSDYRENIISYLELKHGGKESQIIKEYEKRTEEVLEKFEKHLKKINKPASANAHTKIIEKKKMEMKIDIAKEQLSMLMSLIALYTVAVIINRPKQIIKNVDTRFMPSITSNTSLDLQIEQYMKYFILVMVNSASSNSYVSIIKAFSSNLKMLLSMCTERFQSILIEYSSFKEKIFQNTHRLKVIASKTLKEIWDTFKPISKIPSCNNCVNSNVLPIVSFMKNLHFETHKNFPHTNFQAYYPTFLIDTLPTYPVVGRQELPHFKFKLTKLGNPINRESIRLPHLIRDLNIKPLIKNLRQKQNVRISNEQLIEQFLLENTEIPKLQENQGTVIPSFIQSYLKNNPVLIIDTLIHDMVHKSVIGQRFVTSPPLTTIPKKYADNREKLNEFQNRKLEEKQNIQILYNLPNLWFDNAILQNQRLLFHVFKHAYGIDAEPDVSMNHQFVNKHDLNKEIETSKNKNTQQFIKNRQDEKRKMDEIQSQILGKEMNIDFKDVDIEYIDWNKEDNVDNIDVSNDNVEFDYGDGDGDGEDD
jgi:hypothetical protein